MIMSLNHEPEPEAEPGTEPKAEHGKGGLDDIT
jgi:hypothetical protein